MTQISAITNLAARQLQDVTGNSWDIEDVLIPYINLGINELCNLKPETYPVTRELVLIAGAEQSLDAANTRDFMVLDYVCNMGIGGATPGRAVTTINKQVMDAVFPEWMTVTADDEVRLVVIDDKTPKIFYTFPPQPASDRGSLKAKVASVPADLSATTDTFPLDDSFIPAMVDYTIYRALVEETTVPNAITKGQGFHESFLQKIGYKKTGETEQTAKGK